ncbi:hypothetical protein ASPSYDRAFT_50175 [Aspergillus sydowii CBS 593.65]|uniref:Uncharacterized protein n=1 Tax=Aspergillus sydowii CBS 593.65 TaxID=1036612 RepID=A0A1L9T3Z2_9EURO|nr:uncharacterized protein ASPSYDRAFT_50175 [Aspergillus sydowii CBS 593.65]OJJ54152.1 hypothetical protein ASPSYDRAFT_50175 [Aspergillus sydowii CBS 593.65]
MAGMTLVSGFLNSEASLPSAVCPVNARAAGGQKDTSTILRMFSTLQRNLTGAILVILVYFPERFASSRAGLHADRTISVMPTKLDSRTNERNHH